MLQGVMAAVGLAGALGAAAADAASGVATPARPPIGAELVKPGLYRLGNGGGGALVRVTSDGLVIVDPERAEPFRPPMAQALRSLKGAPPKVRAVILTAVGPEQAGRIAPFIAGGTPVIVQTQAAQRLAAAARARGAVAPGPLVTFENDYMLLAGDVQVEVENVGRGRTGADSVVFFRDLRVLAVGGLYTAGALEPDCASGGSFAGWAAAIAHLMGFDFDLAVPSRGAPVGKTELAARKTTLEERARRDAAGPPGASGCGSRTR
jgi:hypothetical protein